MNHSFRRSRHRILPCLAGILLGAVCMAGCATPRATNAGPYGPTRPTMVDSRQAQKEVDAARAMIEAREFSGVVPRLLLTMTKYPRTAAAADARYWLAVTYYNVQSYRDAISMFEEYIELAPDGQYLDSSQQYLAQLRTEYDEKFPSGAELDGRVAELTEAVQASPGNVDAQLALADALWRRGSYEDAGRIYSSVLRHHEDRRGDPLIRSRFEYMGNGEYILLTPSEIQRQQTEAKPLQIANVNAFRSGEDLFTRMPRYYVVTGQARNLSESVLYGVQVFVTIYGFGNVVYDTSTVNIGRLNPGETRAFSVRFSNFDNIENVRRHEAVGAFQR
jgi:tetratricopeptide (TPR) repeat protein